MAGWSERHERPDVGKAQPNQVWDSQPATLADVAQRIAALVAVRRGIRHGADAHAVEHYQRHAFERPRGSDPLLSRFRKRSIAETHFVLKSPVNFISPHSMAISPPPPV